jgi:hypothetical protein
MIVNGVWALGEPADEAVRQVELLHRNLCALANNFADGGPRPAAQPAPSGRRATRQHRAARVNLVSVQPSFVG